MAGEVSLTLDSGETAATLSGRIVEFRVGVWYAELELDGDEAPVGAAVLSFGGIDFAGSVVDKRTVNDNGRTMVRLDGGSGRLDEKLESQSFRKTTIGGVLNALAFQTGDVIAEDSQDLDHEIPYWTWGNGHGEAVLHALAAETKSTWRVQRDGTLWFGQESWPEIDGSFVFQQGPQRPAQMIIFPDELPLVRPGTTFQGRRVAEVITSWGPKAPLQQQIVFQQTATPSRFTPSIQTEVVDWFDRTKGQELDLSKLYPCKVVGQSADWLTVDLMPDDAIVRGSGLRNVPIRFGVPGLRPRLKVGARCQLSWEAADPKRPFAALFERDGIIEHVTHPDDGSGVTIRTTAGGAINIVSDGGEVNIGGDSVNINGPGNGIVCQYDLVSVALPTAVAPGSPCAPALPGAPAQIGVIITARTNVKAGGA